MPPSDRPLAHPIFSGDEISVSELVRALWRYRAVVLAGALLGAMAGTAVSLESTRYVSDGLFMTPGMTLAGFKKYEAALANEPRLEEFIRAADLGDKPVAEQLRRVIRLPGLLTQAVRPVFELTGRDARTYDIGAAGEASGVVGVRLTMKRPGQDGKAPVLALAEFLRSTIIAIDLHHIFLERCMTNRARETGLRNEKIEGDFAITQMEAKAARLRELIAASPGARELSDRQVVSLKNGGDRFLPPAAQLVAAEVGISDLRLADHKRQRDAVAVGLKQKFFCDARSLQAGEPLTGHALFERIADLQEKVFEGQDLGNDVVEHTFNELLMLRRDWQDSYLERMHFVVPPDDAEVRLREPRLSVGVMLGAALGILVGMLGALLLAWWHDNRASVLDQSAD